MPHPAIKPESVAVVTGGAAGIGLAAGETCLRCDMIGQLTELVYYRISSFMAPSSPSSVSGYMRPPMSCEIMRIDGV